MSLRFFMDLMNKVFPDILDKFVFVFINSILIYFRIRVVQRKRGSSCVRKEVSSVCYCLRNRAYVLDFDRFWKAFLLDRIQKLVCFGLVISGSISIG